MNASALAPLLDQWQSQLSAPSEMWTEIFAPANLRSACRRVVSNQGAPGVDGLRVQDLEGHLRRVWPQLRSSLVSGRYVPQPVRAVDIPKPDGGRRRLGIPSVLDRFLQQAVLQVLSPRLEPEFSEFSFAFRPGRTAHGAVAAMQRYLRDGFVWVAHLDIEKFFDRVPHDTLLARLGEHFTDALLSGLILSWLQAGALVGGEHQESPEGTPQGGPLSPLLANVALHSLDRELEAHGIPFVRYADDCVLLAGSHAEVVRYVRRATDHLAGALNLPVNPAKTQVGRAHEIRFLGFTFGYSDDGTCHREVSEASWTDFERRLQGLTAWHPGVRFESALHRVRPFVTGWCRYYGFAETPNVISRARAQARCALRELLWHAWGTPERRHAELCRRGISQARAREAAVRNLPAAAAARTMPLTQAVPNRYFDQFDLGEPKGAGPRVRIEAEPPKARAATRPPAPATSQPVTIASPKQRTKGPERRELLSWTLPGLGWTVIFPAPGWWPQRDRSHRQP